MKEDRKIFKKKKRKQKLYFGYKHKYTLGHKENKIMTNKKNVNAGKKNHHTSIHD